MGDRSPKDKQKKKKQHEIADLKAERQKREKSDNNQRHEKEDVPLKKAS